MGESTSDAMFCPHLSFKVSLNRNHESQGQDSFKKKGSTAGQEDLEGSIEKRVSTEESPSSPEAVELVPKYGNDESSSEGHITCDECTELGINTPPRSPYHLWRCLDPRCKLLLCGRQVQNHSQSHCQEYPTHVLQENAASKRIWCNECNHEVFTDHRNRRSAPGVWMPAYRVDEDIPRGLYNIGNTCFMNAALQCMLAVNPLTSYLLGQCSNLQGKNVALSYLWLLSEMWSDDPYKYQKGVMPSRLLHSVRATHPIFRGFQQHDTQEFLRLFMDTLAEETRVPHFVFEEVEEKREDSRPSDDGGSSDSETESFETCDSGNASEETMSTDVHNGDETSTSKNNPMKDVKIAMRSIVSDIFDGRIESSAQCLSCKQVSSRIEVFQDLSLPIPTREELLTLKKYEKFDQEEFKRSVGWLEWIWDWVKSFMWGPAPTLEDCFAAFFSSDELKGKNMYSCEKCKKLRNGVKRCSLYHLPEVLCVHLKRFRMYEYSGGMGFSGKLSQYVQFPMDSLELGPFLNKDCPNQVTTYRLIGIICHIGSFLGGHYISYVRRGDQWYLCDDARVVPVSADTVAQSEAYVLFYQKYGDDEDETRQSVMKTWAESESDNRNDAGDNRFQLISRKWLTQFFWSEEVGPIDNSDVICPHGLMIPYEFSHYGATWIPQSVWKIIQDRYGGGPSLSYNEECVICTAAWRKHLKSVQKSNVSLDSSSDRE